MFTKAVLPDTLRAIKLVSHLPSIQHAYLAGGTALALQLGHRISVNLDFFTREEIDEDVVSSDLTSLSEFRESQRAWRTVLGTVGKTKFSIFYYKFNLIDALLSFEGIRLAGKKDIAAMKIQAISDRGTKRDFIDTYLLAKEFTLETMLDFYNQKFGVLDEKLYSILKGLDYFVDADMEEMPKMLISIDWDEVKAFFHRQSQLLAQKTLQT